MSKNKIILVEDDAIEAMDIKRTLELFGFEVPFVASSGEEAIEKSLDIMPDLVVMDIVLKGEMNGIDAAKEIIKLEIPIIYLTAHSDEYMVEKAKYTRPYGYIIKPYEPNELKYAIELAIYKNKMEKKLKASEKRYRSIVELANEGIWSMDADFKTTYVNQKMANILGYSVGEMIGKKVTYFMFEEELSDHDLRMVDRKKGVSGTYERYFRHKNGFKVPTIVAATAIQDDKGQFAGSFAMLTDISDHKKLEKDLKNSQRQLEDIINGSPVLQFVIDKNHKVLYWNQAIANYSGISSEEIIGTDEHWRAFYSEKRPCLADLIVDKDIKFIEKWYSGKYVESKHLKGACEVEDFFPSLGKGGKWLHFTAATIKDSKGDIIGAIETLEDITERKIAEEKYRNALENMMEGCQIIDPNWKYLYVNDAASRHGRVKKEDLLDHTMIEVYPGIEDTEMFAMLDKVMKERNSHNFENYFVYPDGTGRWFELRVFPVPEGIFILSIDINERKKAEETLNKQYHFLQSLIDSIPYPLFYKDENYVYINCNNAFEEFIGLSKNEIIGKTVYDVNPKDLADKFHQKDKELFENPGSQNYEAPVKYADGTMHEVLFNKTTFDDEEGNVAGLIGVMVDITERKKAENTLIGEKKFTEQAINAQIDTLFVFEIETGQAIRWNKSFREISGYTDDEIKQLKAPDSYYGPEDLKKATDAIQTITRQKKVTLELSLITKDGRTIPTEYTSSIIKNSKGDPQYIISVGRDITERKIAEEALKSSESFLNDIINQSPHPMWISDAEGTLIRINQACMDMLNITEEEVLGKYNVLDDNIVEEQGYMPMVRSVFEEGHTVNFDLIYDSSQLEHLQLTNFAFVYLNVTIFPVKDSKGKVTNAVIQHSNITEQKKAERALKHSEVQYRAIFENSKSAVAVYNAVENGENFIFKDFNYVAEELEKVKRKDIIGRKVTEVFPGITEFGLFEVFQRVWKTGEPEKHPISIYKDERIWGWRENYVYKLPSGDIVAVYDDLTEIKQYEEELEKNQARLKILVKILQHDAESVQEFLDYALEEAIKLTESKIGYIYHYYEDKKQFVLNTWSKDVMKECSIIDQQTVYELDKTGIWGEAVRQRKPIILNDFQAHHPLKKGYPKGHAPLHKYMTIPVVTGDKIVAVVGMANKETDYTETDVLQLELLMDAVWKVLDSQKAEEALIESETRYRAIFENTGTATAISEENMILSLVNEEFANLTGYSKEKIENKMIWTRFFVEEELPRMEEYHYLRRIDPDTAPRNYESKVIDVNGNIKDVFISAVMIPGTEKSVLSVLDITEKKQSRIKLRKELGVNKSLARIYVPIISPKSTLEEITVAILEEARKLTKSEKGFVSSIDPKTNDNIVHSLSRMMPECKVMWDKNEVVSFHIGSDGSYPGLWGHCLNTKKSFYTNNAEKHHSSKGAPEGHVKIEKFLGIPVLIDNEVAGEIALANKVENYSDEDIEVVERIAEFFAMAIQRKRYEEQISNSLDEKVLLLREIHHRVKNNLQIISSILNLQSIAVKDKNLSDVFKQNQNRIKAMAMIHEKLYNAPDLAKIDFSDYLRSLTTDITYTYLVDTEFIDIKLDLEDNIRLNIETAIPCGLIFAELVSNSIKHAFKKGVKGEIKIEFKKRDKDLVLTVSDNGLGLPDELDFRKTESLGLQLVNNLVEQLEGSIKLDKSQGTKFTIKFSELQYKQRM